MTILAVFSLKTLTRLRLEHPSGLADRERAVCCTQARILVVPQRNENKIDQVYVLMKYYWFQHSNSLKFLENWTKEIFRMPLWWSGLIGCIYSMQIRTVPLRAGWVNCTSQESHWVSPIRQVFHEIKLISMCIFCN